MTHILDNPAWNALNSGNKHLANGNDIAKYFSPEVSPFAGLIENTSENLKVLYEVFPFNAPVGICTVDELAVPEQWNIVQHMTGFQMVYQKREVDFVTNAEIIALSDADIPQMLELTHLTKPGPFAPGTIDFGNYEGIFEGKKLVAMAGRRLHCFDFIEISAVCTHPQFNGKGYARQLIQSQVQSILKAGATPYLHVRDDNARAIEIYQDLGFKIRTAISFYILGKKL